MKALIVAAVAALFFGPFGLAHATTGRDAVGMCIDSTASGARCVWSVNPKGEIDICNKNGCVYCKNGEAQCEVTIRRTVPTNSLPPGAVVTTPLGDFKVSPRTFDLSPLCRRGEIKCPLIGCVPVGHCDFQR